MSRGPSRPGGKYASFHRYSFDNAGGRRSVSVSQSIDVAHTRTVHGRHAGIVSMPETGNVSIGPVILVALEGRFDVMCGCKVADSCEILLER